MDKIKDMVAEAVEKVKALAKANKVALGAFVLGVVLGAFL